MIVRTEETIVNKINARIRQAKCDNRKATRIIVTETEYKELRDETSGLSMFPACLVSEKDSVTFPVETFAVKSARYGEPSALQCAPSAYYQGIPVFICPDRCVMPTS